MLDEWPERIPSTDERAAVAFHYERAQKARAPQTLLLAVCPDGRATWDDDLIAGTLQEALELAKIRTVDLDSVLRVGQILPALYFALNLQGATVSTNFTAAKRQRPMRACRFNPSLTRSSWFTSLYDMDSPRAATARRLHATWKPP